MIRLIYASTVVGTCDISMIQSIVASAKTHNPKLGISGALFYSPKYFIQLLEGSRASVSRQFLKIAQDKRHSDIEILTTEIIHERMFHDWSMGVANERKSKKDIYYRYSIDREFNPYQMTGKEASGFFEALRPFLITTEQLAA